MTVTRTLAQALFKALPIPFFARRDLHVERVLQERRAAAIALECIEANMLCLKAELDNIAGASPEAQRTLAAMRDLVEDIERNLAYDELEFEHASAEI